MLEDRGDTLEMRLFETAGVYAFRSIVDVGILFVSQSETIPLEREMTSQLDQFRASAAAPVQHDDENDTMELEMKPLKAYLARIQDSKQQLEDAQDRHMELGSEATKTGVAKHSKAVNELVREALNACSNYDLQVRKRFTNKSLSREEGEARLRENAHLRKKIVELSKVTWKCQRDHRDEVTQQVARRVNERFEHAGMEKRPPEEAQKIAQSLIRSNKERMLFRLAVLELEEAVREREAVDEIEQSVAELLQIMEEYKAALDDQTQLVLATEENVRQAEKHTRKAEIELKKAVNASSCCCVVQ